MLVGFMCLACMVSGMEVLGIGMVFAFVKLAADPSAIPDMLSNVEFLESQNIVLDSDALIVVGVAIIIYFIFRAAVLMGAQYLQIRYSLVTGREAAARLFAAYIGAPYIFLIEKNTSELINNTHIVIFQSVSSALLAIIIVSSETLVAISICALLLFVEPVATAVTAGVVLFISTAAFLIVRNPMTRWGRRVTFLEGRSIKAIVEAFGGIKDLKVMGKESHFHKAYVDASRELDRTQYVRQTVLQSPRIVFEALGATGIMVIAIIVLLQGDRSADLLAVLALFAAAGFRLVPVAGRINSALSDLKTRLGAMEPVMPDIQSFGGLNCPGVSTDSVEPQPFENHITLENVAFTYPSHGSEVVEIPYLKIEKGQFVGITGSSGAGKTTLAEILMGLLPIGSGSFLVDDADVSSNLVRWQRNIGFVPQSIYLIDDTLNRNVAFGMDDKAIDAQRVREVLDLAQLSDFVSTLPDGGNTIVGENGVRLSGGQRQRIGIARALYNDPPVLIFDEATSALDSHTERDISEDIFRLSKLKTVIVIAHRLSTIRNCERIILMKDGKIAGDGSFDDLQDRNAAFREMVRLNQLESSEPSPGQGNLANP